MPSRRASVMAVTLVGLSACHPVAAAEHASSETAGCETGDTSQEEENTRLARRFFEEVWDQGNVAAIDALVAPGYLDHSTEETGDARENLRALVTGIHESFSEVSFQVEALVAEGDLVVLRFRSSFVHSGEYMGIAPSGNRIETHGIDIYRFADGRIVEEWESHDRYGMLSQMGVLGGPEVTSQPPEATGDE